MQQLVSERLRVRAALLSLKQRPHDSSAAAALSLRDKMRDINTAIRVCFAFRVPPPQQHA
jgi:hypothetical protein